MLGGVLLTMLQRVAGALIRNKIARLEYRFLRGFNIIWLLLIESA